MELKELTFTGNSSTEWKEFNKIYHDVFWDKLNGHLAGECKRIMQTQINEEFNMQIGATKYERVSSRIDKRNGYRNRSYEVLGRYVDGLRIPRARNHKIHYSVFGLWERVESKVLQAMVTAYLLGKSARSAQDIIESFGQSRFSRTFLCKLVKGFEDRLKEYKDCKIDKRWSHIFIDGMAVKLYDTLLKDKVVIFALGMDKDRNMELLGWIITDEEDETSVRSLLINLKQRGLTTPKLFVTDGAKGIISAIQLEYLHTPWQLCSFHKIKNIQTSLKDLKNRKDMLREAGDIYQLSETKKNALKRLNQFKKNWQKKEYNAVRLFTKDFEHTLRYFDFPKDMWISIRTTNPVEQFIGKMRSWISKFNYFHGKINLELAMFTYLCYKKGELVPNTNYQKDTLLFD